VFRKKLVLARLLGILAISNENYRGYNFRVIANISGNFPKISGNIKFPENLQQILPIITQLTCYFWRCIITDSAVEGLHCWQTWRYLSPITQTAMMLNRSMTSRSWSAPRNS